VRAVIRRRLRHLSDQCTLILVLAAVLGREFELDALDRVSGVSRDALLEILDEASRERVVTEVPGAAGRRRFAHALIRDAIYEDLTPGRRAQLERRVGEALETLYADDLEPRLSELAHHFLAAVPAGEAEKAIDYAWRAGDRAKRLFAFEEAIRLYQLALTVTANAAVRCDLLLALGEAQSRAGDTPASNTTFREAAERAISLELPEQLARAALGYGGRISWEVSRDDETLAHLLELALAALGEDDSILRARLLARLAGGPLRDSSADAERRRSLGAQALAMARRIGEPSTLAHALAGYLEIDLSPESTRARVELAQELIQVALAAGETERAVEGYNEHLEASIELGDLASAHADLEAMAQLAEALRQPSQQWLVAVHRAALALLEGRFDEAEKLIAEARSQGEQAQRWSSAVSHGLQLYVLRRGQGRLGEIEELARRSAIDYPTYPVWRCVLANLLAELSSTDEARVELEALAIDGFSALPFDEEWDVSLCLLAETAARLGEPAHAATIYPLLLPYTDRVAFGFPDISLGPISRYLGLLAETTGRYDEAANHFEHALAMCQRLGARPWLVHAQEDFAQVLHTRGRPGDAERARDLLAEAHAARRALGMEVRTTL
jgi:predicted ATPase